MKITKRMRPVTEGITGQCPHCLSEFVLEAEAKENYVWGGDMPEEVGRIQISTACRNCYRLVSVFVRLEEVPI